MKKVLYVSNIEVPYRVKMFNELSKFCDLTVLYERKRSTNRNAQWTESEKSVYKKEYIEGKSIGTENSFSLKAVKKVFGDYDWIIIGCFNSPVQMLMILLLRLFNKRYIINIDGEIFAESKGIKSFLKKFFLRGADKYLTAGEKSAESLRKVVGESEIIPYYFSSLTEYEIKKNSETEEKREDFILVVGQYEEYKGMDVAFNAARMNPSVRYKFIGMGSKTDLFKQKYCPDGLSNIEFIPFLQKADLEREYQKCAAFVLPSRQECWGLVINEAASFGTPIVSTWGSGAAVEFLADSYSKFLAVPDNHDSLYNCIADLLKNKNEEYSQYLLKKSREYTIEKCVSAHLKAIDT